MNTDALTALTEEIAALPEAAQRIVADLVASLHQSDAADWLSEPAFGMWRNRPEMQDSTAYVRERRAQDAAARRARGNAE